MCACVYICLQLLHALTDNEFRRLRNKTLSSNAAIYKDIACQERRKRRGERKAEEGLFSLRHSFTVNFHSSSFPMEDTIIARLT